MKESINKIANTVVNGRKRMARQMVLNSVASIPALVFEKVILPTETGDRKEESWGGLGVLSEEDEHAFSYEKKGCSMVLLDQFTGAALNRGLLSVDGADASFMAQIEPFNDDIELTKQPTNTAGWVPESGDVLCLMISEDFAIWVENVGQQGQTIMSDFGVRYLLNKRDDLSYLTLFEQRPEI